MLGGGTFISQNKVLPGTYINLVSAARATDTLSSRGIVAVPLLLDWGIEGEVFTLNAETFEMNSLKMFGYSSDDSKLRDVREIFKNAKTAHFYRLNPGVKAAVTVGALTATAKYSGTRGNKLRIVVKENIDNSAKKDVITYFDGTLVERQIVATADALVANDFVVFSGTGALTDAAGADLVGGANKESVIGADYQLALDAFEAYNFNVLICPTSDVTTANLFVAYTKRLRDDLGIKFQTVVYKNVADHEGIISVENMVLDAGANAAALTYWVGGAASSAEVNKSIANKNYDGEYQIDTNYTQSQLEANLVAGKFMFHKVGSAVRILDDINSFVSYSDLKGADFSSNQVIRILDQIANDIALIFANKYLGKIQNNTAGRISLWNEIVSYNKELERLQAIENFNSDDVKVEAGESKTSVVVINPVTPSVSMSKLYMTVIVN
ncbi:phage tail sheath family protein [Fusibacter bizertensis]